MFSVRRRGMTINKGSKGLEVTKLQNRLLKLGYELPRYGADGDYGNETYEAVKKYQSFNALPISGNVDNATYEALFGKVNLSKPIMILPNFLSKLKNIKMTNKTVIMSGIAGLGLLAFLSSKKKRR